MSDEHLLNQPGVNQPPPLADYNAWAADTLLQYWVSQFGGAWARERLHAYGELVGGELMRAGFEANRFLPELLSHDGSGERIDLVRYHPAYHRLMAEAVDAGLVSLPWRERRSGSRLVRAALFYLHNQADAGSCCPLTMSCASVSALRCEPTLAQYWEPRITAAPYDGRNLPFYDKDSLTIGMAMTERQGGSDVRANTTRAYPSGTNARVPSFELVGHKWFCSAPMSDAFLVLAYTDNGMSCFLAPRWRPDGGKNAIEIQRLKDKLGNLSNASSEVEFHRAFAWRVGEEGRGINTILQMVALCRFDCMLAAAANLCQGAMLAIHHTGGREAFGQPLHRQPLMQNVLADLALEAEAGLAIALRTAHALDNRGDPLEDAVVRLGTAIGKYWTCKRVPQHSYECMECVGGVGFINDNPLARLYRDAPVNAIWEGSGNLQCLDILRVMQRETRLFDAFLGELYGAEGLDERFDRYLRRLVAQLRVSDQQQYLARQLIESLALAWQGATLLRHGESMIAEAFISARLCSDGQMYGTLPANIDCSALIARAQPKVAG
ncbi:acyl-CoA dehydrogenase family protein [Marinobacterium zhoushanense]|nr:acyl-CoA dehydrogenase family protein [Marinobacterium zhoushanense]